MKNFKHVHKTDFEKRYIENSQFNIVSIEGEKGFQLPLNSICSSNEKASLYHYNEYTTWGIFIQILQTCSWYRKFIPNFSHIARPLSNVSKKSTAWKWSEIEQQAFQTLKQCLITPPILRQVDPKKPFIIRMDASSYALGAVLLQGESPTDEQPVEYASKLLSSAEKNYSTTEREALAVVWALNKFRGYIEGAEITVASDHQPLKWLMNLTSPTGRLARDGHFIYNLTI
ncbi:retrovirus-related Pol polyprotein from transposon 297 [Trichonephila clavipes]|nr:retrovirus-related Pol polyprotein from transposon 297 [Trichonephila clavipes]